MSRVVEQDCNSTDDRNTAIQLADGLISQEVSHTAIQLADGLISQELSHTDPHLGQESVAWVTPRYS
jgi:hypothetical protein